MRNEKTKYFHTNFGCGASDVAHSMTDKMHCASAELLNSAKHTLINIIINLTLKLLLSLLSHCC